MSDRKNVQESGCDLFIVFLVFLVLKLTGELTWSWWWITSPLWIPIAVVLLVASIAGFCYGCYELYKHIKK